MHLEAPRVFEGSFGELLLWPILGHDQHRCFADCCAALLLKTRFLLSGRRSFLKTKRVHRGNTRGARFRNMFSEIQSLESFHF